MNNIRQYLPILPNIGQCSTIFDHIEQYLSIRSISKSVHYLLKDFIKILLVWKTLDNEWINSCTSYRGAFAPKKNTLIIFSYPCYQSFSPLSKVNLQYCTTWKWLIFGCKRWFWQYSGFNLICNSQNTYKFKSDKSWIISRRKQVFFNLISCPFYLSLFSFYFCPLDKVFRLENIYLESNTPIYMCVFFWVVGRFFPPSYF